MILLAKQNNNFFRSQSITTEEIDKVERIEAIKQSMLIDESSLSFEILTDEKYYEWINSLPKPVQEPTEIEKLRLEQAQANAEIIDLMMAMKMGGV